MSSGLLAQELESIKLNPPDLARGHPFMEALSVKASASEWSDRDLSLQDLSDLMWAANGLNRPDEDKTTASSAMNAHDVDIYVFMKDGVFVYDYRNHELDAVVGGDHRSAVMMRRPPRPETVPEDSGNAVAADAPAAAAPPAEAAIQIVLISDSDRFRAGTNELKYEWGAIGAGIISQNISLFCAATGLKTRPRASMDKEKIKDLLKLKETQYVFLNHPVGYAK
ncbi:MAG: nitroreductase family protein [Gemmatimonadota bacterium]|nr:MAG: nitroreductase family protein [Gemmatimonadota bacterium]